MMIPGDEATGRRPFICFEFPALSQPGRDYFLVSSLTGLRILASGQVEVDESSRMRRWSLDRRASRRCPRRVAGRTICQSDCFAGCGA